MTGGHLPVMLAEVMRWLSIADGDMVIDATFGGGGYSRAALEAAECTVLAVDRDPDAVARAESLAAEYPGRVHTIAGPFGDLERLTADVGVSAADAVMFDLGLSSYQIDQAERGFSFRADGPLDMRMGGGGETAADAVARLDENALTRILRDYGEERRARAVARRIVETRDERPIMTTAALADLVRAVVRPSKDGIDPATRTFQALRIFVNDEMGELRRGLVAAEKLLKPGGRLVVVAFHSLEDRQVKTFLNRRAGRGGVSRHAPQTGARPPSFELLTRKPETPLAAEIAANPRARSAKLRAARRTAAEPWPPQDREAA